MNHLLKIIILICSMAVGTACNSRLSVGQRLDAYFDAIDGHFMGSVLVQKDGRTVYEKTIGYADVENRILSTTQTQYRIGSISKTFTAVLVLKAAEEGRLSLDDPLDKYFPDAHIANAEQITIDHLLQHRSGLRDISNDMPADYLTYFTTHQTRDQMVERIASAGTKFPPDSAYSYCNAGYLLLSYILEDVGGKSYAELIDEQIVQPLDLRHTRYSEAIRPQNGDSRSYNLVGDWQLASETDASVVVGAGAMASTPTDLSKFGSALFGGFFGKGVVERMKQIRDGYGRGLVSYHSGGQTGYGHSGAIDGFAALLVVFDDVVVALCSNGMDRTIDVSSHILDIVNGREVDLPSFSEGLTLESELLESYAGTYCIQPMDIEFKLFVRGEELFIEQMEQVYPLVALSDSTFVCGAVGLTMVMDPSGNCVKVNQAGSDFVATKR